MRNKKAVLYFVFIFCLFASACSQAVVIDFDDLERDYPDQVMQLTDQYANKGVIFDNAYLASWPSENSITGPGFSFSFVGELPVYVSFVLNNLDELKNSVLAAGPNNFLEILSTEGGEWALKIALPTYLTRKSHFRPNLVFPTFMLQAKQLLIWMIWCFTTQLKCQSLRY